ncbi:MAG: T9SS type A sorting domain-containing protein [Bacteroidia bacterium]
MKKLHDKVRFLLVLFLLLSCAGRAQDDPASSDLNIRFKSPGIYYLSYTSPVKADLQITIASDAGEPLYNEEHTGFEGKYERILDMRDLSNGIYFVRMMSGSVCSIKKVVVQK